MSTPIHRWSSQVTSLPADSSGRRFLTGDLFDVLNGAIELRMETILRQLFSAGGVTTLGSVALVGTEVTLTGPVEAVSDDMRTPLLLDPLAEGVTLDLAVAGSAFADGDHLLVLTAAPVTSSFPFETPPIAIRDDAGNVLSTSSAESLSYTLRRYLGTMTLREGTTPAEGDVSLATVTKAGASWSALTEVHTPPELQDLAGLFATSSQGALANTALQPGADAADIAYDNSTSGLTATTVQAALDEIAALLP